MQNQDELQNVEDEVIDGQHDEVVDDIELEDEQAADSEPASDADHEAKDGTDPKIEERIGELTRKRREAERLAEQREQELRKLQKQRLDSSEPVIPSLPDPEEVSEHEHEEAINERDQAIQARVQWQAQQQHYQQSEQYQSQQQQYQRQQEMAESGKAYNSRAAELGVKPEELAQAGAVINQVGINDEVAMHILGDGTGPAITRHLGKNVADLLEVANSSPLRAAVFIEQKIKPKLRAQKRKTKTPPPPNEVKGGAPSGRDERFPLTSGRVTFK